jgi:hypothetical protein
MTTSRQVRHIRATVYARLPWSWTLPTGFDLAESIAPIINGTGAGLPERGYAVITLFTRVQYAIPTQGVYHSHIIAIRRCIWWVRKTTI